VQPFPRGGFWTFIDRLWKTSHVCVDRPSGSAHPRHPSFIYPLDYGYLVDSAAPDGAAVDVWLGSRRRTKVDAAIWTVDLEKRDLELKLLVGCTADEIRIVLRLTNVHSMRSILIRRARPRRSRAPNGLTDRVKLRSCERPEAQRGRILDGFDRGATKGRDANARFHDGRQTVRRSRRGGRHTVDE